MSGGGLTPDQTQSVAESSVYEPIKRQRKNDEMRHGTAQDSIDHFPSEVAPTHTHTHTRSVVAAVNNDHVGRF